jgi:phosphatidylserine/phosphatidylglycerophosphate/cardiolipin synthase-like enzyme/uncharacterized membrane protein YdjX (TVP38/TMEM64 family)
MSEKSLFKPGQNCWRTEWADQLAFLIDGEAYFSSLRAAMAQAQRSILILCWDIDSRFQMVRGGASDCLPCRLDDFLLSILARRRALQVHALTWDFHMIFAFERQWWQRLKKIGSAHRRLHFHMDAEHPVWASHHQKIAVVDDAVGFVGGLDPTKCRWDTQEHRAHDPRRIEANGKPYRPFHDVQMMVSGDAAKALGDLCRERWYRATGCQIEPPPRSGDLWPPRVKPDLEGVRVAIARTEPAFKDLPEVREVEQLYVDSIRAARRFIYIETQYLTADRIRDVLAARLAEPGGPEILVVVHPNSDGWLEQHTMDVLRGRVVARLREADKYNRLAIYCPCAPAREAARITMHSKVLIIDDDIARVGSSNLTNRSMGLDTECDLAVEAAGNDRVRRSISDFRNRLLAEHLGVEPEKLAEAFARPGSRIAVVERLRGPDRSLIRFEAAVAEEVGTLLGDANFLDPEQPLDGEIVARDLLAQPEHRRVSRRGWTAGVLLLVFLALAAAWRYTPLGASLDIPALTEKLSAFQGSPAAPIYVIGGFLIGGIAAAPVTALIAITVLALGPWYGFFYSLIGMTLSALAVFGLGCLLGREAVQRLAGPRLSEINHHLAYRGLWTVIAVRVVPVAPFSIVNLVAGASAIRFRDFAAGTIIGVLPGLITMALFMDRVTETVRNPSWKTILLTLAVVAAISAGAFWLRRWIARHTNADAPSRG